MELKLSFQLKGCPSSSVKSEVDSMVKQIGLQDKKNTASKALSGGMKRKLCVGIALIAGSKVCSYFSMESVSLFYFSIPIFY